MSLLRTFASLIFAVGVALAVSGTATSAEPGTKDSLAPASPVQFEYRPYAWLPFMTGDTSLGSNSTGISTNIFEVLGEVDHIYAYMSYQEARIGRLGIFADIFWTDVGVGASTVRNSNPIAGLNTTIVADADVDFTWAIIQPGIAFEIGNRSSGGSFKGMQPTSSTAFDIIAGARYWYMEADVDLAVNASVNLPALGLTRTGAGSVSGSRTVDWWDPFIGLRMRHKRASGSELMLKGDIGGAGIGSDFTWQAEAGYSFDTRLLGHDLTGYLGYRALYVEFDEGNGGRKFGLDLLVHGPQMGLKFQW